MLGLLLFCGVFFACHKDDNPVYGAAVSVTFAGRVLDENNQPIVSANVYVGEEQTSTDENGVFRLKSVRQASRNAILHITKNGYFDFSRAYVVRDESIQSVTIQLLRREQTGMVNGGTGGTILLSSGASLNFPGKSVVTKSGATYTGSIRVFARYLDPADDELYKKMPGDLRAFEAGGKEGILTTFGMLGVELESPAGELLQIAPGSEVEIKMPIATEQAALAPTTIALWHYDLEKARWVEEGSAEKIGNEYVGKVKHFSFWNCDSFSETVLMEGKVFLGNLQSPLANAQVRLTVLTNGFKGYGMSDGAGWFGGAIPKGYEMKLEILLPDECGEQVLYTQNIGPFNDDVVLPDIILNNPTFDIINIKGRVVDCNGNPAGNAYLLINIQGNQTAIFTASDGTFEINSMNCINATVGTYAAYNLDDLTGENGSFSLSGNQIDLGEILVCTTLAEYFKYTLDGHTYTDVLVAGGLDVTATQIYTFTDTTQAISIGFFNSGQTGTFPISFLTVQGYWLPSAQSTLTTTVTDYGATIGSPIIGTFGTSFTDFNGTNHTLTGSYRVLRDW